MINPIALVLVAVGILLLLVGLLLVIKHRKAAGIAISVLGLGFVAAPFLISFLLYG